VEVPEENTDEEYNSGDDSMSETQVSELAHD
jgi:hypothetical protein